MGCSAVWFIEIQPTFGENVSPPSALLAVCFHARILLSLFFNPEDEGHMCLKNVS
jgi:hypothetical protein